MKEIVTHDLRPKMSLNFAVMIRNAGIELSNSLRTAYTQDGEFLTSIGEDISGHNPAIVVEAVQIIGYRYQGSGHDRNFQTGQEED